MKNDLEENSSILNDKNKVSKFFVHRNIKYSDRNVTEKVQIIEEKISNKKIKGISFMHLYI